jgi:predicted Fe-S protein YdhL (DUF1289 family)
VVAKTEDKPRVSAIISPCIKVCVVDPISGLCIGCGRSLAEIGGWLGLSDAERRALMAILPARLAALPSPPAQTSEHRA